MIDSRRRILAIWTLGAVAALIAALVWEPWSVRLGFFVATLALEIVVLITVFGVRRRLAVGDEARRPWTWIGLGLGARVLAELRLATLYFECMPGFIADRPGLRDFYILQLRYFYVAADLMIAGALVVLCRAILGLGLGLRIGAAARGAALLVVALPITQLLLQRWAFAGVVMEDPGILDFRVISVLSSAVVGALSLALAGLARQMGGGHLAMVWGAAALAGLAKALAFLVGPLLSGNAWAPLCDQLLLWTFACAWGLAAAAYREMVDRT